MSELPMGCPRYFSVDAFLDVVEGLIMSDETERALYMLENLFPAFYREPANYPARATEIKTSLHRQLFTPAQYAFSDSEGADVDVEALSQIFPPRAQVLAEKVKAMNDGGIKPNIMELAPGIFCLPYALKARGLEFTYEYQSLVRRELPFDKPTTDGINILVCYELAEHLSDIWEIYRAYLKFKKEAQYLYLSTPLYSCGSINPDWRNSALGHLKTFSPQEFYQICSKMFQGFEWKCHLSDTITLEAVKK